MSETLAQLYERGDHMEVYARADVAARSLEAAQADIVRLRKALGYFMADERFQVAIGGNPTAVEKMLAEVRAIFTKASSTPPPIDQAASIA